MIFGIIVAAISVIVIIHEIYRGTWIGPGGEAGLEGYTEDDIVRVDNLSIDRLNELRGMVRDAYITVLERYPSKDEQTAYVRLLANDQTSFSGIMDNLKRTDEYKSESERDRVTDPLPPRTKSMVEAEEKEQGEGEDEEDGDDGEDEDEDEEEGGDLGEDLDMDSGSEGKGSKKDDNDEDMERRRLRRVFKGLYGKEPSDKDLTCMKLALRTADDLEEEDAAERCGGEEDEEDYEDVTETMNKREEVEGGIDPLLGDMKDSERDAMELMVRDAFEEVMEEEREEARLRQAEGWEPEELTQPTIKMWTMVLWKANGDVDELKNKMRGLRKASMGFPIDGFGARGEGGNWKSRAALPPGLDPDPYALSYVLDADPLGRLATKEERERMRRKYEKERKDSYGVGKRYDASTVEEALMQRSRKMDAAELQEKREDDLRKILEKSED